MKTGKTWLTLLVIAALVLSLSTAAFAEGENPAEAAQEYRFVCTQMSVEYLRYATGYEGDVQPVKDHYVAADYGSYTVNLFADGTGYLYLGENNQGPIDSWALDGNLLMFKAGVSDFDGTIIDGIMTLDFDDGLYLIFAAAGADTSEIQDEIISAEAFADLVVGRIEGVYDLFAMGYGGQIAGQDELNGTSVLRLDEGGTGSLSFDDEAMDITSWSAEGDSITVLLADGSEYTGTLRKELGVIELDISGYMACYGREGADTEIYLAPDSRLHAVYESIDADAGAHLKYTLHTDYMDATSVHDVHAKGGIFYSDETTQVSGYEGRSATFYQDGNVYSLNPDNMTGMFIMNMSASLLAKNPLVMDTLYAAIQSHALRSDYVTETRDGYTVDIYPANQYEAEAAFTFDDAGNLVAYLEGPPVIDVGIDIGESSYQIESIDTAVNESLFDISGYSIEG